MNTPDDKQVATALGLMNKVKPICYLCQQHAEHKGMFIPDEENQTSFGGKPGKTRMIAYAICDHCVDLPDSQDRVEAKMLSRVDKRDVSISVATDGRTYIQGDEGSRFYGEMCDGFFAFDPPNEQTNK